MGYGQPKSGLRLNMTSWISKVEPCSMTGSGGCSLILVWGSTAPKDPQPRWITIKKQAASCEGLYVALPMVEMGKRSKVRGNTETDPSQCCQSTGLLIDQVYIQTRRMQKHTHTDYRKS